MSDLSDLIFNVRRKLPYVGNDYLTKKERFRIYEKIATSLTAGETLGEALASIYQFTSHDGEKPNLRPALIIRKWQSMQIAGLSFADMLRDYAPITEVSQLATGAEAKLPQAIDDLVMMSEKTSQMSSNIRKAFMFPIMYLLVSIAFTVVFGVYVAPSFYPALPASKWEFEPALMAEIGQFFYEYWYIIAFLIIGTVFGVYYSLPRWTGDLRTKFDKLPPWSFYKLYHGANFMLMMSSLKEIGKTDQEVVHILSLHAQPWLLERLNALRPHLAAGKDIGFALWKSGYDFPDSETVIDLRSYASKTDFAQILRKTGTRWLNRADKRVESQAAILKVAGQVMFFMILAGFITAITVLQNQVGDMPSG